MTQRQTERAAQAVRGAPKWLTSAADDPAECRTHWLAQPSEPRLLATGRTFEAVVVSDELGIRALDGYRRITAPALPTVIDHKTRKIAFLISCCGAQFFADTIVSLRGGFTYRYLACGDYLSIPGPLAEVGARQQWLCPPRPAPDLSAGAVVMLAGHLVSAARWMAEGKERPDGEGEE